jgi:predicted Zn-dependent peptidase
MRRRGAVLRSQPVNRHEVATPDQVNAALRRHIDLDRLTIVVAGEVEGER